MGLGKSSCHLRMSRSYPNADRKGGGRGNKCANAMRWQEAQQVGALKEEHGAWNRR